MPELPEVQTTVNGINTYLKNLTVSDVWTDYGSAAHKKSDTIKNPAYFVSFKKEIIDARIVDATRRGKNVLINLSNGKTLLIHMKMTGHVMHGTYRRLAKKDAQGESWRPANPEESALHDPFNRFIHFVLTFSNGTHMVLSDVRKFAKVTLIETAVLSESTHLKNHGPEPLDPLFTIEILKKSLLRKPEGAVKLVLMNPEIISGIGNIYSDEILWRIGIHPLEKIKNLPNTVWPKLFSAIQEILSRGIDFGGDSLSDYRNIKGERGAFQNEHTVYRKTGTACIRPRCSGTITRIKMGGRSAHFCDVHQRLINKL